jgi:hypothetical protein
MQALPLHGRGSALFLIKAAGRCAKLGIVQERIGRMRASLCLKGEPNFPEA